MHQLAVGDEYYSGRVERALCPLPCKIVPLSRLRDLSGHPAAEGPLKIKTKQKKEGGIKTIFFTACTYCKKYEIFM
jgi:hypothetical protein